MEEVRQNWKWFLLAVAVSSALFAPSLWYPLGPDQGLYAYAAWIWRDFGLLPYAHTFDHNFPGIFFIHYFVLSVLGKSGLGFRVFDLVWQILAAAAIFMASFTAFKDCRAALLASALSSISYIEMGPWHTGQRDTFLTMLYLLGFLLAAQGITKDRLHLWAAASGLALGLAFSLKPVALAAEAAILVMIFSTYRSKLAPIALSLLGFVIPFAAMAAYFQTAGVFGAFWRSIFGYNSEVYALALNLSARETLTGLLMQRGLRVIWVLIAGAAALIWQKHAIPAEEHKLDRWLFLVLLIAYLGYVAQGKYYVYHMAPFLGVLSVFAGAGWSRLVDLAGGRKAGKILPRVLTVCVIILAVAVMQPKNRQALAQAMRQSPARTSSAYGSYYAAYQASQFLKAHSGPQDEVQVLGMDAIINYLAERKAPTRFVSSIYLLLKVGPEPSSMQKALFGEFMHDLYEKPPLYFAVETLPYREFGIASAKSAVAERFPEFKDFIVRNYSREAVFQFIELYRRRLEPENSRHPDKNR